MTQVTVLLVVMLLAESTIQADFDFPEEGGDQSTCDMAATKEKGVCTAFENCTAALNAWKAQKTDPVQCYFRDKVQFVCCPLESDKLIERKDTLSDIKCKEVYDNRFDIFPIVHGTPALEDEFVYMSALSWDSPSGEREFRCGGVLISPTFVLTAAHCSSLGGNPPKYVRVGGGNLTLPDTDIAVKNVYVHPLYRRNSSYNDIALVELETNASYVQSCLWTEAEKDFEWVTAIGYGDTEFAGTSSTQLQKADLKLYDNPSCSVFYPPGLDSKLANGIQETQICAGDPEKMKDTCQGDSGGPILRKIKRKNVHVPFIIGITSFGQGCAGEVPSVYTKVSAYLDWIEGIVWKESS